MVEWVFSLCIFIISVPIRKSLRKRKEPEETRDISRGRLKKKTKEEREREKKRREREGGKSGVAREK